MVFTCVIIFHHPVKSAIMCQREWTMAFHDQPKWGGMRLQPDYQSLYFEMSSFHLVALLLTLDNFTVKCCFWLTLLLNVAFMFCCRLH